MASGNYIKNVAVVGAGGNSGRPMAEELLKTGKHTVTALARADSTTDLPKGVIVRAIDYADPSTIVAALRGQDALVITLGVMAPPDTQEKLIKAAAEAGVQWIFPNEWSPDSAHEGLIKDVPSFIKMPKTRELIKSLGKSSYVAVSTGFWYEWSLAIKASFGFDFENKEVTLFDDGTTKMSISTWPQVGRAVAGLLSLPVKAEDGNTDKCLDHFRDGHAYVASFTLNQRDMLNSVLRVTGTKLEDWKVTQEPVRERYSNAMEAMKKGDRVSFAKAMYSRVFFPDESGDFEKRLGTVNQLLGLPKEDLDEFTKVAIERSKSLPWNKV